MTIFVPFLNQSCRVGSYPTRFSFKVGGTLRVATSGNFLLFVIGISSLIPHSGFLIRHFFLFDVSRQVGIERSMFDS